MKKFPTTITKVPLENLCDVCKENLAGYYDRTRYIHVCSLECFKTFLDRYLEEIDAIAIEVKNASDLKEDSDDSTDR